MVSGWRIDDEKGAILLVTDPTPPVPEPGAVTSAAQQTVPAPPATPEERIEALERQLQGVMHAVSRGRSGESSTPTMPHAEEGGLGWLLLTFGQIVSALGCLAAPISALIAISRTAAVRRQMADAPNWTSWIIGVYPSRSVRMSSRGA